MQCQTSSISSYLNTIGKYQLLDRDKELELTTKIQKLVILNFYKKSLSQTLNREPTITEWAKVASISQAFLIEAIALGKLAKNEMMTVNLRLVVAIAKQYQ